MRVLRACLSLSRVSLLRVYLLRGRPLLCDIRGGSLKMLLSNDCCFIKCQPFMRIGFKLGTAG